MGLHSLYQISAKTGEGVFEMFENIGKLLVRNTKAMIQERSAFAVNQAESEKATKVKQSSGSIYITVAVVDVPKKLYLII